MSATYGRKDRPNQSQYITTAWLLTSPVINRRQVTGLKAYWMGIMEEEFQDILETQYETKNLVFTLTPRPTTPPPATQRPWHSFYGFYQTGRDATDPSTFHQHHVMLESRFGTEDSSQERYVLSQNYNWYQSVGRSVRQLVILQIIREILLIHLSVNHLLMVQ